MNEAAQNHFQALAAVPAIDDQTHNPTVDSDPDSEVKFGVDSVVDSDILMQDPSDDYGSDTA